MLIKTPTTKQSSTTTKPYVIVRSNMAGVFAGYLESRVGPEVTLINARRIWRWVGASALNQLAMEGVKNAKDSKIEMPTNKVIITEVCEIQFCSEAGRDNILSVPEWKQ